MLVASSGGQGWWVSSGEGQRTRLRSLLFLSTQQSQRIAHTHVCPCNQPSPFLPPCHAPVCSQNGCLDLILRKRRGFVRLALQSVSDLVPVLAFGENECYQRGQLVPGSLADCMQRATKSVSALPASMGAGIGA